MSHSQTAGVTVGGELLGMNNKTEESQGPGNRQYEKGTCYFI